MIGRYKKQMLCLSSRTNTDEEIAHHCDTCMFSSVQALFQNL